MSTREKRRSERKSIHDCKAEFKITRNVSDSEIEIQQYSGEQVPELSEHDKLYKAKKALIDEKLDMWIKLECERADISIPTEIPSCFDPTSYKNSIQVAKSAIENRIYLQKAGNAIRTSHDLQAKILQDAANTVYEEPCDSVYN
ncbi:unnamed protein product [Oikopleura dioica]|uniref:Uncharacterized protein n=1 Tax=Oikopleura dioica TaxID=34765 RepID=E4XWG2_OIKDI|nr:unnamed protein product [Oikopleura dioica]